MAKQKYDELQKNLKLRKKIIDLGFGCSIVGPTGPKGEQGLIGPTGPAAAPVTEEILFTSFEESNTSGEMQLLDSWILPNESKTFQLLSETEIEVQPGIYEIDFSCFVEKADDNHGATIYLKDENSSAIRDLHFNLEAGTGKQMNFSQIILFRFEKTTILQVLVDILGDEGTSNITVSNTNLLIKKIYEN